MVLAPIPNVDAQPLPGIPLLILSAGHWPGDEGAQSIVEADGRLWTEHDLCSQLCWYVAGMVQEEGLLGTVAIPPGRLVEKISDVNKIAKTVRCVAVELHMDAGPPDARGTTVFVAPGNTMTSKMAGAVLTRITKPSWPTRGVKTVGSQHASLGWIMKTVPPAMLIECGFLTNSEDRKVLGTSAGLMGLARGLAAGLRDAVIYMTAYERQRSGGGSTPLARMKDRKKWRNGLTLIN
jgi:N-acetylmuramoyl-L-alanine amidase